MSTALPRQNAVSTLQTAAGWLTSAPALVGLFLVVGLFNAAGQLNPLVSLLGNLVTIVTAGIAHLTAADLAQDRPTDLAENARAAVGRLLHLIGIGIIVFIATFVAALFLLIPGIYVGLRLGLAPVACVVDEEGIGDSLSTSWELAQGDLLKLLGIQLATFAVSLAAIGIALSVTGGFEAFIQNDRTALFQAFLGVAPVTAIVGPIAQLAIARVYLENRSSGSEADTDADLTAQPGDDEWNDGTDDTGSGWDDTETESQGFGDDAQSGDDTTESGDDSEDLWDEK